MPALLAEDYEYPLPKMYRIRQHFPHERIGNIEAILQEELKKKEIMDCVRPGMRIAIAVGSRGIQNLQTVVRQVVKRLQELGAEPFIVSAMGSHGGGTEKGQKEVLEGYGITEEFLGVPVITTVDTIKLGNIRDNIPVYFDKSAYEADLIVPINRIKLHTDFVGKLQSGLCKMLVIGLGNHKGCSTMHEADPIFFAEYLEEAANLILQKARIGFGVALMENAYDETCFLEAVPAFCMIDREKELVQKCVGLMPFIRIKEADMIVVREIGKNISGAGYDPNILGRSCVLKTFQLPVPVFQKMVLLDITEESHGNAIGLGQFDVVTRQVVEKMNREITYANAIACKCIEDARIPVVAENEEEAIRMALKVCRKIDREHLKIIRIQNTLQLGEIEVSEALLLEVIQNQELELCEILQ